MMAPLGSNNSFVLHRIVIVVAVLVASVLSLDVGLNDGWTICNGNGSIQLYNQTLPSGVYSALEAANLTGSVLDGFNDRDLRWVSRENWTYGLQFDVDDFYRPDNYRNQEAVLVFHGIDTIATIHLNGQQLSPAPQNMFVRYRYDVRHQLRSGLNTLTVELRPPVLAAKAAARDQPFTPPECPPPRYNGECHMNQLRKMQASFAWDWGLAAPSVGLWKSVVLELYQVARLRDVTYKLQANESHWTVDVTVHMESGTTTFWPIEGVMQLEMPTVLRAPIRWPVDERTGLDGELKVRRSFTVARDRVELWWTNGLGKQPLYELRASWETSTYEIESNKILRQSMAYFVSEKTVRVGFRTLEIVEETMEIGSTFYFRLNGVAVFMKGSNWIPSHILPERANELATIDQLLQSAADVHMNMLRVWGGGLYESDEFYDRADELGILIWQDMMFACAMYPVRSEFLRSVTVEVRQNVRRLQSHPSIAVWAGNNENEAALVQNWYGTKRERPRFEVEYARLYADTIGRVLREEDEWHPWLFSSPSNGPLRAEQTLIHEDPQDRRYGDIHFYEYFLDGWNPDIYPRPRFASEYGFQSYPALPAWLSVQPASANNQTTDILPLMDHRQHFPYGDVPILLLINQHLPLPAKSSANYAEALPYLSQISQAMVTRTETEVYRVGRGVQEVRTMGALYWQLNDVWVAPSWSSIEYGGNYKILQYWAAEFFAPVAVVAQFNRSLGKINVHIVRDTLGEAHAFGLRVQAFSWRQFEAMTEEHAVYLIPPNSAQLVASLEMADVLREPLNVTNSFLRFQLYDNSDSNRTSLSTSFLFPGKIKEVIGLHRDPQLSVTLGKHKCVCNDVEDEHSEVDIRLSVRYPALFVYITVQHTQVRSYHLSENGFVQLEPERTVRLRFRTVGCAVQLKAEDLRVQTVNEYMKG